MVRGVDYSNSRPDPAGLVKAGFSFACRYVGLGSHDKLLTKAEVVILGNAGISVVANAEGVSKGPLNGFNQGVRDGHAALAAALQCGMPQNRPIYFSVDWDVQPSEWVTVRQYFIGVATVVSHVGIYGGFNAVTWAKRDNVAQWFWQTYAWSGGKWAQGNHIEQYRNSVIVAGGEVDLNEGMVQDYGQWKVSQSFTGVKESKVFVAHQGDDFYVCDGMYSRPITRAQLGDLKTLVDEGHVDISNIDTPRDGWYEGAFGAILTLDVQTLGEQLQQYFATHPATDTLTAGEFRKALTAIGATYDAAGNGLKPAQ